MVDGLKSEWTSEIYMDFPQHKKAVDRLIIFTENSKDLIRDYYICKSNIQKFSSEKDIQKMKDYQVALDALKEDILEIFRRCEE